MPHLHADLMPITGDVAYLMEETVPIRLRCRLRWRATAVVAALVLSTVGVASAKDLAALAELITPAYTAMNFGVVCATRQPNFLSESSGPRGNVLSYAEHVKNEVIDGLDPDEAVVVLRGAANAARTTTLETIRKLNADDSNLEAARIRAWCETDARHFIRAFLDQYDGDHDKFLERLKQSK